jgi:phenylalanyl-tRNA synthetase beta chain
VYEENGKDLPAQQLKLAGLVHKPATTFLEVKGFIEQLLADLEIKNTNFKQLTNNYGAAIFIDKQELGTIEILDDRTVMFELDFATILKNATLKKIYSPISKYPPVVEDLAIIASENVQTGDLLDEIEKQSNLIREVSLLDKYHETRTFHIVYQSNTKNLTDKEVGEIREKILKVLKGKYNARLKD